jgi:hypothetical protein
VVAVLGLCSLLVVAPAQAHDSRAVPVGSALIQPSASYRIEQVRPVWIWANYWACEFTSEDGTIVPRCSWVPNHWALIPDSERCYGAPLAGAPGSSATVCTSRVADPHAQRAPRVAVHPEDRPATDAKVRSKPDVLVGAERQGVLPALSFGTDDVHYL